MSRKIYKSGFTLIELTIVIVIIGLIAGGLLAAQQMVFSAKLNKQISQIIQYETAIRNFKETYKFLPGDLPSKVPMTCPAYGAFCYGDGNGVVGSSLDINGRNSHPSEVEKVFYHLSSLGFIKDSYSPVGNWYGVVGTSYPEAVFSRETGGNCSSALSFDSSWTGLGYASGPGGYMRGYYENNNLWLSSRPNASGVNCPFFDPAITPLEAFSLDNKMDDGNPAAGNVVTNNGTGGDCVNLRQGNTIYDARVADYNATNYYGVLATPGAYYDTSTMTNTRACFTIYHSPYL